MKKVFITISSMYDITQFVVRAARVKGPGVNVYKGNTVIDGASLISMVNLDATQGITVEYPENDKDFEEFLQQFMGE